MKDLFLQILNMAISAGWITLGVILLRPLAKKLPKWFQCFLWTPVGLRLLLPRFPESRFSVLPSAKTIPETVLEKPMVQTGITAVNDAINPALTKAPVQEVIGVTEILALIWAVGVVVMLLWGLVSYLRLRRQTRVCIRSEKGVYLCDNIDTPFILGILRPRICLPPYLSREQTAAVLAHEKAHLRRRDHWWKPLGYLLLSFYWFHPLLWVGYILLCRDIERACDEKVIRSMTDTERYDYSQMLLSFSLHRKKIAVCPVAFGEVAVKNRIRNILSYKKPTLWILLVALVITLVGGIWVLTDPPACKHSYKSICAQTATCTHEGTMKYTCTKCWESYTESLPMISHNYGQSFETLTPTCIREGQVSATCISCGQTHVTDSLPKSQVHVLENTQLRAPTCTDAGEGVNTCKLCGYTEGCTYELAAHDFKNGATFVGTCVEPQKTQQICQVCGLYEWAITGPKDSSNHFWIILIYGPTYCRLCGATGSSNHSSLYSPSSGYNDSFSDDSLFPSIQWAPEPGGDPNDFSWLYP